MRSLGIAAACVAALALAVAAMPSAGAAPAAGPGTLDPTFGQAGIARVEAPDAIAQSEFEQMLRQPDGKLLLESDRGYGLLAEIQRRLPGGRLDPSFGQEGRVKVGNGEGMALRPDGSIAVGVTECGIDHEDGVILLDPSGSRVGGSGQSSCGQSLPFEPELLAAQGNDDVIVAGSVYTCPCGKSVPEHRDAIVARLLPDGNRDPSFGSQGIVNLPDLGIQNEFFQRPVAIAPISDGGVLVTDGVVIARLTASGVLDPGFAAAGKLADSEPGDGQPVSLCPNGILPMPDGRFVVAAAKSNCVFQPDEGEIVVSRYLPDGRLDSSFGEAGRTHVRMAAPAQPFAVAAMPGGGALVLGQMDDGEFCRRACVPVLARLGPDGVLDQGYGSGGVAQLPPLPTKGVNSVKALVTDPEGGAVVAGNELEAYAAALTPTGTLDSGFGEAGTLIDRHYGAASLEATGIAGRPGGGFTVAAEGTAGTLEESGFLVGYDTAGLPLPGPAGSPLIKAEARGRIAPGPDGAALFWAPERQVLRAVGPDGKPVSGYGKDGIATVPKKILVEAVVAGPRDGAMVLGTMRHGPAMAVYRLDASGRPLAGFGDHGLAKVHFPGKNGIAYAGLIAPDGKVVVTGSVGERAGVARLLADGRLDRRFGRGGRVRSPLRPETHGSQLAALGGGYLVAVSKSRALAGVLRLDRRGRLIRGFDENGVLHAKRMLPPMALFADRDRVVLVARTQEECGVELRAFDLDGAVDGGFGGGGVARAGTDESDCLVPGAAIQDSGGRVVVAGIDSDRSSRATPGAVELLRFR